KDRLLELERETRRQSVAGAERMKFLLQASITLSSSLDYKTTIRNVVSLVTPSIADWCAIDMLEPNGTLHRLAAAHVNPAKAGWLRELIDLYPPDMEATSGIPGVLRNKRS